jgi:hypothetical protein
MTTQALPVLVHAVDSIVSECRESPELRSGSPVIDGHWDVQCQLPNAILDASGAVTMANTQGGVG